MEKRVIVSDGQGLPAAPAEKKWFFVNGWFDLYSNCFKREYVLSPDTKLAGIECPNSEKIRKGVVRVKNVLKSWGHKETYENILNAAEFCDESRRLPDGVWGFINTLVKPLDYEC